MKSAINWRTSLSRIQIRSGSKLEPTIWKWMSPSDASLASAIRSRNQATRWRVASCPETQTQNERGDSVGAFLKAGTALILDHPASLIGLIGKPPLQHAAPLHPERSFQGCAVIFLAQAQFFFPAPVRDLSSAEARFSFRGQPRSPAVPGSRPGSRCPGSAHPGPEHRRGAPGNGSTRGFLRGRL
jgi:hypothetical protein